MNRPAAFLWLAVALAAGIYLSARLYEGLGFRTDLMALLPREEQDPSLQKADDEVTGAFSRRVAILVGDKDRTAARVAAKEMARRLASSGSFDVAADIFRKDRLRRIGSFYYPYRSGLLAEEDRLQIEAGRGDEIARRALSQVYGVFGMADAKLLQGDPFLLMPGFLTGLPVPLSRLSPDDGLPSLRDNGTTWVLIAAQVKGDPFALDVQNRAAKVFDDASKAQRAAHPGLEILHLGAVFFAKAGAGQAMNETSMIGIASLTGTIFLIVAMFRALPPLVLSLVVIGMGVMMALSASLWIFGELHVGALLFGVSLIGVAVDYSLQYCSEIFAPHPGPPKERLKRVLAGISLGTATTVIGYLTLFLAPFPGLRQIAAFSAIGLLAAWLTVVLWLPLLDRETPPPQGRILLAASGKFLAFWNAPGYRRIRAGLLVLAVILGLAGFARFHADDDVRHMQALSPGLVAEQEHIQKLTGMTGSGPFFLVQAPDDETALHREEQLAEKLRPLVGSGALTGFQSPAQYIPSAARQMENRNLQRRYLYEPLLAAQSAKLDLTEPPRMPTEHGPILTLAEARGPDSPLPFLSNLILDDTAGQTAHMVMLDGVARPEALAEIARGILGVRLIDPANDFSSLLEKYRNRAMALLALSAILMVPLLIWRYGPVRGLWIMAPPSLAVILTPALRGLMGGTFTFFDAMALVLVLSIGVDYSVFCAETSGDRKPVTMLAVTMAAGTALLSFGLLALSGMLAVHNFGATMTIGILLSFLFAPMACLAGREHRSFSLRHIVSLVLVLLLSACASQNGAMRQTVSGPVEIAPGLSLTLPDPGTLGRSLEATQLVTAHYGHRDFSFEAHIKAAPEHFLLIGLDPTGRRIMTVDWTKNGITYEKASWIPSRLRPESILADLVLLYWPDAAVRRALAVSSGRLIANTNRRTIMQDSEKIWSARYEPAVKNDRWTGRLHYRNLAWDYEFDVQSAETAP